ETRMQAPLNRDPMLPARHTANAKADALAGEITDTLQASGLFAPVRRSVDADLPALGRQLLEHRLALVDAGSREALIAGPEAFIQQRLQRLYNPFEGNALVPVEQDWFGIADLAQRQLLQPGNVQAGLDGHLAAEYQGQRWAVIHARTHGDAFDDSLPLQVERL